MSLLFARILGDTAATEAASSPELTKAKQTIKELRVDLDEAEIRITDAESRATAAEQRFAAAGDLFARLFAEEKRQRITAASELPCYQVFTSIERLMNELLAPAKDQSTENVVPADGERTALGSWSARNNSNLPELFANGDLLFYDVRPANGRPSFNSWYRQSVTICRFTAESPSDDLNRSVPRGIYPCEF